MATEIDFSKLDSQLHGIETSAPQNVPVSEQDRTSSAKETNPTVAVKPVQVTTPVAPPVAPPTPNTSDLAEKAAAANKSMATSASAPVAPNPLNAVGGNSAVPFIAGAATAALGMIGYHHLFGRDKKEKGIEKEQQPVKPTEAGKVNPATTEGQPQVSGPTESELISPDEKLNTTPGNVETPVGTEKEPFVDTRSITEAEKQNAENMMNQVEEINSVADIGKEKIEPGAEAGKTQVEATAKSTGEANKKSVKGAAVPRRSKQEAQVANEEMPFNKYYNQIANRLAGTENLREHPHITEQFDKAWEDVFHNVLGGKMEKSKGGAPSKIHEIETHINANAEKYPDLVKYMNEAKAYGKGGIHPTEGGSSHLGAMLGMLGAGGLGAYMVHRYGKPYEESMEKANKAMGEAMGTQDLGKANKAEELSPAIRQIFMKSGNPNYRKELNAQLATEKEPGRIAELQRELEKAK